MDQLCKAKNFIQVEFLDGRQGAMGPTALELCLRQQRIRRFRRASGWVSVDVGPLRGGSQREYTGQERRSDPQSAARSSTRLS